MNPSDPALDPALQVLLNNKRDEVLSLGKNWYKATHQWAEMFEIKWPEAFTVAQSTATVLVDVDIDVGVEDDGVMLEPEDPILEDEYLEDLEVELQVIESEATFLEDQGPVTGIGEGVSLLDDLEEEGAFSRLFSSLTAKMWPF